MLIRKQRQNAAPLTPGTSIFVVVIIGRCSAIVVEYVAMTFSSMLCDEQRYILVMDRSIRHT